MEEEIKMLLVIEQWHLVPSKLTFTVRESQRELAIACERQCNAVLYTPPPTPRGLRVRSELSE